MTDATPIIDYSLPILWQRIADLEHDIDQYREIDQENQRRIAQLEARLAAMEQAYKEGITYGQYWAYY